MLLTRRTVACVSGRRIVELLAAMGFRTVVLDDHLPFEITCLADVPIEADLDDWTLAAEHLRKHHAVQPIDAVLSVRDSYVPLAAYLADALGVRGLSPTAARSCNDKAQLRRALDRMNGANPPYAIVTDPAAAVQAADGIGYPLVVKRTRSAGGAGVRFCTSVGELRVAAGELSQPGATLLVEQYIDGPELAVQAIAVDGAVDVVNVLSQRVGPPPRMAETGYDFPADLAATDEKLVTDLVIRALAVLRFDNGVAHVQVRLGETGPRIVEVNPRPPGGELSHLTEIVSGVDLVRACVEATVGDAITRVPPQARLARYRCVVFDRPGVVDYDRSALERLANGVRVSLDVEPGDLVYAVDHPDGGVYGRILVFGDTEEELDQAYRQVETALNLQVGEEHA